MLAICVHNRGSEASLELGKAYKVVLPQADDPAEHLRVIDEEGEDYLYQQEGFVAVKVDSRGKRRVMKVVA